MTTGHKMKIEVEGFEVTEKLVKEAGNSGRVYVPKDWINKRVKIVLLEPIENEWVDEYDRCKMYIIYRYIEMINFNHTK